MTVGSSMARSNCSVARDLRNAALWSFLLSLSFRRKPPGPRKRGGFVLGPL
ncbi:hypothetical protein JG688_00001601 [Phytophthora aleatoria]|uniref:Uncharacterized protein n=1 Tax=Phytophthora aleatoria TaxID=2496075 RepID=A0A8J5J6G4_9STRA|nr:hypothetical protein JG688_00001601 [Phytophthora aleatoria]